MDGFFFNALWVGGIGFRFLVPSFMKLKEKERETKRWVCVCVCVPVSVIGKNVGGILCLHCHHECCCRFSLSNRC